MGICVGLLLTSIGMAWLLVDSRRNIALDSRFTPTLWSISLQMPAGWVMHEFIEAGQPALSWQDGSPDGGREIILSRREGVGEASPAQLCEQRLTIRSRSASARIVGMRRPQQVDVGRYHGSLLKAADWGYLVAVLLDDSPSGMDAYYLELISKSPTGVHAGDEALFARVLHSIQPADRPNPASSVGRGRITIGAALGHAS